MASLSVEPLDRFEKLSARVGEPLWPYENWFTVEATEVVSGVELELVGDLGALSIEMARLAYCTKREPRRENVLVAPKRLEGRLVWSLADVSLAPQRDVIEEVTFNAFDMFGTLMKMQAVGDDNFQRILSVAMNARGTRPGRGTLLLRARTFDEQPESAAEARLPFEIHE